MRGTSRAARLFSCPNLRGVLREIFDYDVRHRISTACRPVRVAVEALQRNTAGRAFSKARGRSKVCREEGRISVRCVFWKKPSIGNRTRQAREAKRKTARTRMKAFGPKLVVVDQAIRNFVCLGRCRGSSNVRVRRTDLEQIACRYSRSGIESSHPFVLNPPSHPYNEGNHRKRSTEE